VRRDCRRHPRHEGLARLVGRIEQAPGVDPSWHTPDLSRTERTAFVSRFVIEDVQLSFLTTLMSFGAPRVSAEDELQLELYFPQDDATERACIELAPA